MSKEQNILNKFLKQRGPAVSLTDGISLYGEAVARVVRFDGSVECYSKQNQVSYNGLNVLASRAVSDTTSPFNWIAIGTLTAAASLNSAITSFGEIDRKAAISNMASSREIFFGVATWGGAADGITSVSLSAAAIVNHVSSGLGVPMNIVTNLGPVVLGDSDFLNLELRIRVGSHNV